MSLQAGGQIKFSGLLIGTHSKRSITERGQGRYDPIAGGERGGDGGAEGVDLAHPLVPPDGAGERGPHGVDALDAVDVGGVDGGGQHPDADVAVPEMDGRRIRHPQHLLGGTVLVVEHGLGRRRDNGGQVAAGGAAAPENLQRRRQQPGRRRHYLLARRDVA